MDNPPIVAGSSTRQACGPVRFGMKGAELQKASLHLRAAGRGHFTAGTLRQWLVNDGVKYPARLAHQDQAVRLQMRFPVGRPLKELTFQAHGYYPAAEYESVVKHAWETLRDVADSKFGHATKKGGFPPIAAIGKPGKIFVTDQWEAPGVHIELGVIAGDYYGEAALKYTAVLKVTDLTVPPLSK